MTGTRQTIGTDLERCVFEEFEESGSIMGLGALADALDESGERKGFAKLLRRTVKAQSAAVHFFFCQCGYAVGGNETIAQARLENAWGMMRAEKWFHKLPNSYTVWEEDHIADMSWINDPSANRVMYSCTVFRDHEAYPLYAPSNFTHLGGIDLGWDYNPNSNPYCRVVVAELASELMEA